MATSTISQIMNHVVDMTNKPRIEVVDDPTASKTPGYIDSDDIATIADVQAAAAIAALGTIGDVRFDGLTTTPGHVAVFTSADGKLIEDGGAIPAGTGDMFGTATATDGNLMVFDVDGYHAKDGGAAPVLPSIKVLTTQFDKTNNSPATITELSTDVVSGGVYIFRGVFQTTSESAGGIYLACLLTGGLSGSPFLCCGYLMDSVNALMLSSYDTTAGGGSLFSTTGMTQALVTFDGYLSAIADGTILIKFSQNVVNANPSSILVGSFLKVEKVV
jgi:hypothetical protein